MSLKYIPYILFLMLLAFAPISNASVSVKTIATLDTTQTPDTNTTKSDNEELTLAQDNSRILATSGMSTMFAIWNMSPPQYCATKLLFNSRHNRLPCKLKAL